MIIMVQFLTIPTLSDQCVSGGLKSGATFKSNEFTSDIQKLITKYKYATQLQSNLDSQSVDVTTLDQKSLYESQQYDNMRLWYLRFLFFYYVMAIILVLVLFLADNQFKLGLYTRIFLSVLLLVYPYTVSYVTMSMMMMFGFVSSFIPKTVYNNI